MSLFNGTFPRMTGTSMTDDGAEVRFQNLSRPGAHETKATVPSGRNTLLLFQNTQYPAANDWVEIHRILARLTE